MNRFWTEDRTSPHFPRPGIHASISYFLCALAPSSSVGISNTLRINQQNPIFEDWYKKSLRHMYLTLNPKPCTISFCTSLISSIIDSLSFSPLTTNNSTFVNWCTLYNPLVSAPLAPASARKARPTPTTRWGRFSSGIIISANIPANGISEVPARQSDWAEFEVGWRWYVWEAAAFVAWSRGWKPHRQAISVLTTSGGITGVNPCLLAMFNA